MAAIAPDTAFDIAKLYASVGAIAWLCCGRCFIHIASALETTAMFRPKSSSRCAKALIPLQSQNRSILAMTFGPTKFRSTPGCTEKSWPPLTPVRSERLRGSSCAASIDGDDCAGDVAGAIAQQESDCLGDILDGRTAKRRAADDLFLVGVVEARCHLRHEESGCDGVDANVEVANLERQRARIVARAP